MMEDKTANTEYACKELIGICFNQQCFDCLSTVLSYASINNSILLCSQCAIKHKTYEQSISELRSLYLDAWSEEHIQYLKVGGNRRLNELLLLYNVNLKGIDSIKLYYSNLMQFHRDAIKSEVLNLKCPVAPKANEALLPCFIIDKELIESNESSKPMTAIIQQKMSDMYSKSKDYALGIYNSMSIAHLSNRVRSIVNALPSTIRSKATN